MKTIEDVLKLLDEVRDEEIKNNPREIGYYKISIRQIFRIVKSLIIIYRLKPAQELAQKMKEDK